MKKLIILSLVIALGVVFFSGTTAQAASNLILGKGYSLTAAPSALYPDTNQKELTDGRYASLFPLDSRWVGIGMGNPEIVVRLAQTSKITQAKASFLNFPIWGIFLPNSVEFLVSTDGVSWTSKGFLSEVGTSGDFTLNLTGAAARYVKFKVDRKFWLFMDEIEAIGTPVNDGTPTDLPLSNSCSYSEGFTTFQPSLTYPDSASELGDGRFANPVPWDSGWVGFGHGEPSVVFNLAQLSQLNIVRINFLEFPAWGIAVPNEVRLETSADGVQWVKWGALSRISTTFQANFDSLPAKYVRFNIDRNMWAFIDEVEIIGQGQVDGCSYYYNQWSPKQQGEDDGPQFMVESQNVSISKDYGRFDYRIWLVNAPSPTKSIKFRAKFNPAVVKVSQTSAKSSTGCGQINKRLSNSSGVIYVELKGCSLTSGPILYVDMKVENAVAGQTTRVFVDPANPSSASNGSHIQLYDDTFVPLEDIRFIDGIFTFNN